MAALAGLLLSAAPAIGHHSFAAEFDGTRRLRFQGVVTRIEWTNPHTFFFVDVREGGGHVVICFRGWAGSAIPSKWATA
jgi:hypothetical protein